LMHPILGTHISKDLFLKSVMIEGEYEF